MGGGATAKGEYDSLASELEEARSHGAQDDLPEPGGTGLGSGQRPLLGPVQV